jgi:type VI secretion system protein ImpF
MPDAKQDRIQPCLFDRLVDESPESQAHSRGERAISLRQYREGVLRDISWLLNAKAHSASEEIYEFDQVAKSVLNYGIPDVCGKLSSMLDVDEIEHEIAEAIRHFEPRIIPNTLSVTAVSSPGPAPHILTFEIRGELWASPIPEQLHLRTDIDLETGQSTLR